MKILLSLTLLMGTMGAMAQQKINPVLDSLIKQKDPVFIQKRVAELGQGNENDLEVLMRYYGRNRSKSDSLNKVVQQRFPKGRLAANAAQTIIFNEPSGEKQEVMFADFKQKFPAADVDQLYYSIAYAYTNSKNVPKVVMYAEKIKSLPYKFGVVQNLMAYDLPAAEKIVKQEVEKLRKADKNDDYYNAIGFYSKILTQAGKHAAALKYTKEAYDQSKGKDDVLTSNYGYLLSSSGKYQEAFPIMQQLAIDGKADARIKSELKIAYEKLNPGKDASMFMSSLENTLKSKVEAEVAKLMIREDAPAFVVKDIEGKTVSLADFKGKTIVLDFWATWCGPCKRSFPAMQMAVDKYKDDPTVKFLFIHTWERAADPLTDAKEFLKTSKYRFDLYMDTKDASTRLNPAVAMFKVKGIPAKFVIDGEGKIRFKLTGFYGGDDAAVEELSAMIENSRKAAL